MTTPLAIPATMPLLGVAYYPEHDPESEWPLDAALMRDLGLNTIRVGEFCWNRMQAPDGTLTLDWLARLIDLYQAHGIGTVLCTPSATPPVWLVERFPDLAPVLPNGRRGLFGGRRHYSVFHEGYRDASVRLAEALARRFGQHSGVVGWHVDNEVGSYSVVDCSPVAQRAWHRYLATRYASPAELNQRWGLIFWNQEVSRFDQVPVPSEMMCTRSPQHLLEYNRFAVAGAAAFVEAQGRAIRPHLRQGQWLVASTTEQVSLELFARQRQSPVPLWDFVELNNRAMQLTPGPTTGCGCLLGAAIVNGVSRCRIGPKLGDGYRWG